MIPTPTIETWTGCYDASWKDLITPESFSHPAKMAKGLLTRILDHLLERGWIQPGQLIADPFGGIGTTGIMAAYRGLRCVSVELEPRFYRCANGWDCGGVSRQKWLRFQHRWERLPRFGELCPACMSGLKYEKNSGVVPIQEQHHFLGNYELHRPRLEHLNKPQPIMLQGDSRRFDEILAGCEVVITSPPYAAIAAGAGGLNTKPAKHAGQQSARSADSSSQNADQRYGCTPGQIAALREGSVQAVCTSPPFEDSIGKDHRDSSCQFIQQLAKSYNRKFTDKSFGPGEYGTTAGQIGRENGDSYWQAVCLVYAACFRALKPGGVIAIVIKDYVKNKQRVPLCDHTLRLLQHLGFIPLERIQALLTKEYHEADLFCEQTTTRTERKSFFRRLQEKRGSPPIDYEEVLFCRKPTAAS